MQGFCDPEGHVAASGLCKTLLEDTGEYNSLYVCPVVEDEMDDDGLDDKEEPSEESRPMKGGQNRVTMPTVRERQEHERTHLPYRSWCRHCVSARASNPAHRGRAFPTSIEEDKDTKQVSYDHCFNAGPARNGVSKDFWFRRIGPLEWCPAHVVPLKGAVIDWVIQQCARDLERLGHYGQVTLRSDQEPAIVEVLRAIANLRGARGTLLEHSPVHDSQSNGLIERGIRSVEESTSF